MFYNAFIFIAVVCGNFDSSGVTVQWYSNAMFAPAPAATGPTCNSTEAAVAFKFRGGVPSSCSIKVKVFLQPACLFSFSSTWDREHSRRLGYIMAHLHAISPSIRCTRILFIFNK